MNIPEPKAWKRLYRLKKATGRWPKNTLAQNFSTPDRYWLMWGLRVENVDVYNESLLACQIENNRDYWQCIYCTDGEVDHAELRRLYDIQCNWDQMSPNSDDEDILYIKPRS